MAAARGNHRRWPGLCVCGALSLSINRVDRLFCPAGVMGSDGLDGVEGALVERIAAAVAGKLGVVQTRSTLTWRQLWPHYAAAEREKLESWNTVVGRWGHVDRIMGDEPVMDATIHTVRRYRDVRRGEFTIRKTLTSPKTRNNEIELVRRMSRWASRQNPKLIPFDPLAGIERADLFEAVQNVRRNVVEDDPTASLTLEQFLDHGDEFDRALVLVAHSSGMRRGELAKLERAWIDRRPDRDGRPHRIVEIPPGVSKGRRGHRPGRQTWVSVEALAAVDAYTATLPFPLQRRSTWVFVNATPGAFYGRPFHKDTFTARFKRLQERASAGGPSGPTWLHDLRRSFITLARRRGEDTSNIMQASGHKTLDAFKRYDIHARRDAIVVRNRVETARADELAAVERQRRGPQRSPANFFPPGRAVDKSPQR